ncbi:aspartyl protease family protein [Hoeflea marina]|uniref:Aspartyl protease family protein n=1 Tax=Hoeflea marina TaxID=274592 RepID=A0A317PJE2_9HYPH|nr:TIGR02281 family clan AA aspartic protease [Hoeflea marina]PWW00414.1 aspartyl protease family protein [Hoeflea marina]
MLKKAFLLCCIALAAAGAPQYLSQLGSAGSGSAPKKAADPIATAALPVPPAQPKASYLTGIRAVQIPMGKSGHFSAQFRVNGRTVDGLIDTGATFVAINQSMARTVGLKLRASDFNRTVRTANGSTRAAYVELDRVEIGSISVSDVGAFVLEDAALSGTLIGMSFLSKLSSYKVREQVLELAN